MEYLEVSQFGVHRGEGLSQVFDRPGSSGVDSTAGHGCPWSLNQRRSSPIESSITSIPQYSRECIACHLENFTTLHEFLGYDGVQHSPVYNHRSYLLTSLLCTWI